MRSTLRRSWFSILVWKVNRETFSQWKTPSNPGNITREINLLNVVVQPPLQAIDTPWKRSFTRIFSQDHRTRSICLRGSRLACRDAALSTTNTPILRFFTTTKKMRRFSTTMQFSRGLFTFFQFPTLSTINFPQIFEWKTVFYGQTRSVMACIKSEVLQRASLVYIGKNCT